MPSYRVTALSDGMILASPAVDPFGRVVLPAGAVIDRGAVNRLLMSKVHKVEIAAAGRDAGASQRQESPAATGVRKKPDTVVEQENLLRLAHMFGEYRDDAVMRELCRLAIKCAQERLISV